MTRPNLALITVPEDLMARLPHLRCRGWIYQQHRCEIDRQARRIRELEDRIEEIAIKAQRHINKGLRLERENTALRAELAGSKVRIDRLERQVAEVSRC